MGYDVERKGRKKAIEDMLRRYRDARRVVDATPDYIRDMIQEEIEAEINKLTSPGSINLAKIGTGAMNGHDAAKHLHARLVGGIMRIDDLKETYAHALEFCRFFESAWEALEEEERDILSAYYLEKKGAEEIMEAMFLPRSSFFFKKKRALLSLERKIWFEM